MMSKTEFCGRPCSVCQLVATYGEGCDRAQTGRTQKLASRIAPIAMPPRSRIGRSALFTSTAFPVILNHLPDHESHGWPRQAKELDVCSDELESEQPGYPPLHWMHKSHRPRARQEGNRRTFTTAHEVSPLLEQVATFYVSGPATVSHPYNRAMLYFRILDCNVVRFRPSRAAAPFGPPTWPSASFNAASIRSRSPAPEVPEVRADGRMGDEISLSSGILTRSSGPLLRITDRSITFWSSRILPGHSYLVSASK